MSIAIIYHDYCGVTTVHITAAQAKEGMAHIEYISSLRSNLPTSSMGHRLIGIV